MGLKGRDSKTRPTEDAGEVKVEVDLLTGAMRVDARELLSSEVTRELLKKAECVEKRINEDRRAP